MTVKELKKELEKYPDDMDVFLDGGKTDFQHGLLNTVRQQEIDFREEPGGPVLSNDDVVILDEE